MEYTSKKKVVELEIDLDDSKAWLQNGYFHRDNDQPAVIYSDGAKAWYQNGKCHRDNDQPAIIYLDGSKSWYQNGKFIKSKIS